ENNFIFASLPDCIAGIVGLIAGKITDEFGKPAFIISEKNELAKGSCRAPECFAEKGFHLGELLAECKDILIEFGGHAQAAGFSLEKKNIPALKNKIKEIFKEKWDDKVSGFSVCIEIDQELEPDDVDWDLLKEIEKMAPFGEGNRQPLFILKKVFVKEARVVGNGSKHLKLTLRLDCKNGKISYIDGIGFGLGNLEIKPGDKIDAVFYLEENIWNGNKTLQLKLKDIAPAK
ncbi:MAG: DHHA1 domain-containing protein, partial [bacterium]